MKTSTAYKRVQLALSEAERLGWDEGVEVLRRVLASLNAGGSLTGWSAKQWSTRRTLLRAIDAALHSFRLFQKANTQLVDAREQAVDALAELSRTNPKDVAEEGRLYANEEAYVDERDDILRTVDELDRAIEEVSGYPEQLDELDVQAASSRETMLSEIGNILAVISDLAEDNTSIR